MHRACVLLFEFITNQGLDRRRPASILAASLQMHEGSCQSDSIPSVVQVAQTFDVNRSMLLWGHMGGQSLCFHNWSNCKAPMARAMTLMLITVCSAEMKLALSMKPK